MSNDEPRGENERAVARDFERFLETACGEELSREFRALEIVLDKHGPDEELSAAIHKRQKELLTDWLWKAAAARAEDIVEQEIRVGRLVRLNKDDLGWIGDLDPDGEEQ